MDRRFFIRSVGLSSAAVALAFWKRRAGAAADTTWTYLPGINLGSPWDELGNSFYWGWPFPKMVEGGAKVTRVELLRLGNENIGTTITRMRAVLDEASKSGLKVIVLVSNNSTPEWDSAKWNADRVQLQKYTNDVIVPTVSDLRNHPALFGVQIWNEPNHTTTNLTPKNYADLLGMSFPLIKDMTTVYMAGVVDLWGYMGANYIANVLYYGKYVLKWEYPMFHVASTHPYKRTSPWGIRSALYEVRGALDRYYYGLGLNLAITEFGIESGYATTSLEAQAKYLKDAYLMFRPNAAALRLTTSIWWNLNNYTTKEGTPSTFGLFAGNADLPKPSFLAFKETNNSA